MEAGETITSPKGILVIGGGISGITAAVEAAEAGYETFLVEENPYLGGRVARTNQYFPKLCPPSCGLELNFRRIKTNPNIRFFTLAQVESISGEEGDWEVILKMKPRRVNDNCTACGKCVRVCPVERPDDFNLGLDKTKSIYLPHFMAFPMKYIIDESTCLGEECAKCVAACPYDAIDLGMPVEKLKLKVGAIILATGWEPYEAGRIDNLGFGNYPNVITNVMMERLAALNGPTQGKIVRLSDGKEVKSIAFVQCAGSRDENYLPYCSGVCCLASLKQAAYIREQNPDVKITIFYIDIRTPGTFEDFLVRAQENKKLSLVKGKVAKIEEDPQTHDLIVETEDIASNGKVREQVGMVVLATGMVPAARDKKIPATINYDGYGFIASETPGIYAAGCAIKPSDVGTSVRSATSAALKAIQSIVRKGSNG